MPVHIGESEVAARVPVRELFMIKPQQVQDCGMKVVNMDCVSIDTIPDVVCVSVHNSGLHATSRQPAGKGVRMVVSTFCTFAILSPRRSSEFCAKHDERLFQQTSLPEIRQQGCSGPIHAFGIFFMRGDVPMSRIPVIPARPDSIDDFDKPDSVFNQTPCSNALSGVRSRVAFRQPVQLMCVF